MAVPRAEAVVLASAPGTAPASAKPQSTAPILTPRDAATLIVLDESGPVPRILMGRRSKALLFMPGKLVFPGGRLEAADLRMAAGHVLPAPVLTRLLARTPARFDARRATALALAALRETFEETGAMIGRAFDTEPLAGAWRPFAERGVMPDPALLVPVARAITPPGPPRRYDTRFFCVSAAAIRHLLPFEDRPDPEFDELGWFPLDALAALDLPGITRQVLLDIDGRLRDGRWRDAGEPMPFYRSRRGRMIRDLI